MTALAFKFYEIFKQQLILVKLRTFNCIVYESIFQTFSPGESRSLAVVSKFST